MERDIRPPEAGNREQITANEAREALSAAARALDELALEQPLTPDAERARELCHDALDKAEREQPDKRLHKAIRRAAREESGRGSGRGLAREI